MSKIVRLIEAENTVLITRAWGKVGMSGRCWSKGTNFSCRINEFCGCNVQYGDYTVGFERQLINASIPIFYVYVCFFSLFAYFARQYNTRVQGKESSLWLNWY